MVDPVTGQRNHDGHQCKENPLPSKADELFVAATALSPESQSRRVTDQHVAGRAA